MPQAEQAHSASRWAMSLMSSSPCTCACHTRGHAKDRDPLGSQAPLGGGVCGGGGEVEKSSIQVFGRCYWAGIYTTVLISSKGLPGFPLSSSRRESMASARRSLLAAALARLTDCPVDSQSTTGGNSRPLSTPLLVVDDSDASPGPAASSCNSDASRAARPQLGCLLSPDAADVAAIRRATVDGTFMDVQRARILRSEAGLPPRPSGRGAVSRPPRSHSTATSLPNSSSASARPFFGGSSPAPAQSSAPPWGIILAARRQSVAAFSSSPFRRGSNSRRLVCTAMHGARQ